MTRGYALDRLYSLHPMAIKIASSALGIGAFAGACRTVSQAIAAPAIVQASMTTATIHSGSPR